MSTENYTSRQVAIQAAGVKLFRGLAYLFHPPGPAPGFADRGISTDRQEAERCFAEGLAELVLAITESGEGAEP